MVVDTPYLTCRIRRAFHHQRRGAGRLSLSRVAGRWRNADGTSPPRQARLTPVVTRKRLFAKRLWLSSFEAQRGWKMRRWSLRELLIPGHRAVGLPATLSAQITAEVDVTAGVSTDESARPPSKHASSAPPSQIGADMQSSRGRIPGVNTRHLTRSGRRTRTTATSGRWKSSARRPSTRTDR